MKVEALLLHKPASIPLHLFAQFKKLVCLLLPLYFNYVTQVDCLSCKVLPKGYTCTDLPFIELFVISYKLKKKQELKLLEQQASTFSI